jgi:hypothetical protein
LSCSWWSQAVVLSVSYIFPENPVIAKLKVLADIGPYWTGLSETREVARMPP